MEPLPGGQQPGVKICIPWRKRPVLPTVAFTAHKQVAAHVYFSRAMCDDYFKRSGADLKLDIDKFADRNPSTANDSRQKGKNKTRDSHSESPPFPTDRSNECRSSNASASAPAQLLHPSGVGDGGVSSTGDGIRDNSCDSHDGGAKGRENIGWRALKAPSVAGVSAEEVATLQTQA